MTSNIVIFSLEHSENEPKYEKMAILLVKSLRDNNPNIEIVCGIFTNRLPDKSTIDMLLSYDVKIIYDQKFTVSDDSINYFLRNYTIHYFNYLSKNNNVLYLDIDVICLRCLDDVFNTKEYLVEEVPDYIITKEKEYIGDINHRLYYNWMHVLQPESKEVYDIDYAKHQYLKESDIEISKRTPKRAIDQMFGAYYPKRVLDNSYLFHYDGFIDSGTFYKLKDHKKYHIYTIFIDKVLKIPRQNDEQYWSDYEPIREILGE